MTSLTMILRFIRKNATAKNDDVVYIAPLGAKQFNLSYTYGDTKNKKAHQLVLTDKAVFRWLRATIGMLEKDADPFELVQLDLPFMPSVVFNATKLGEAYHSLLDAVEFHLDNWPTPDDLNDAFLEEYDEEYADMPPLTPAAFAVPASRGRHHLFLDEDY